MLAAFARAFPAATSRLSGWSTFGAERAGTIELEIDGRGAIVSWEYGGSTHAKVRRVLDRVKILLRRGKFSLPSGARGVATIAVRLRTESTGEITQSDDGGRVVKLGFDPPSKTGVARGYFRLASGLRVQAYARLAR